MNRKMSAVVAREILHNFPGKLNWLGLAMAGTQGHQAEFERPEKGSPSPFTPGTGFVQEAAGQGEPD